MVFATRWSSRRVMEVVWRFLEVEGKEYAGLVSAFFIHHRRFGSRVHAGTEYALHHRPQRSTRAPGGIRVEPWHPGRLVVSHRRRGSRRIGFAFVVGAGF